MSYTKVQFIGYAINTGPKGIGGKEEYVGVLVDPDYPQSAENLEGRKDINTRFQLLDAVLSNVQPHVDPSETTLKIFVLPEFFFRGPLGGYSMDQPNQDFFITWAHTLVGDAKFTNWFFILGTTLFFWTKDIQNPSIIKQVLSFLNFSSQATPPNDQYINYSLCIGGGFGKDEQAVLAHSCIVQKQLKSGIDFIQQKNTDYGLVDERTDVLAALKAMGQRPEAPARPDEGSSVVPYEGINIGIEVCLDHAERRLKRSQDLPSMPIQVVPSCGMWIMNDAIVATKYVFNCDGLNPARSPQDGKPSYVVGGTSLPQAPQAHTTLYAVAAKQVVAPIQQIPIARDVSTIFPYTSTGGAGVVHIYGSLNL